MTLSQRRFAIAAAAAAAGLAFAGCTGRTTPTDPGGSPRSSTAVDSARARPQTTGEGAGLLAFEDWTDRSGIEFVHTDGSAGRHYIMETVSCGLALFDYDGDGRLDIYFCNGAPLPGSAADAPPRHALYRNLGGMTFRDVSEEAGVACRAFGLGIAVGDYNNDGHPDIYLSNFGPNALYRNNGDGTFTNVAPSSCVERGHRVGAGACFLDIEADGDLDLFAANYVQFSEAIHRAPKQRGRTVYPGPLDYPQETNSLFRNEGNGGWTDVSVSSGIAAKPGTGMGTVCGDFDQDGDTDIYVANDEMANFLYQNDGLGGFVEVGVFCGAAFDDTGHARGSMGAECGDFDNDGQLDLFVTAYQHESASLYRNLGRLVFQDVTLLTHAGAGTAPHVTWGCCLADLDNDGDRDLFIACGHLDDRNENSVYRARNLVLKNLLVEQGVARFENVSDSCGDGMLAKFSSRGAAVDDLDGDGDLDVVVLNSRDRPTILKNLLQERGCHNHWLRVALRGTRSNRDGVGARVHVVAQDLVLVDEVHSGRGYQSHWGSQLHFGLGPRARVDRIEVHWIGGGVDVLTDVPADRLVTVRQSAAP